MSHFLCAPLASHPGLFSQTPIPKLIAPTNDDDDDDDQTTTTNPIEPHRAREKDQRPLSLTSSTQSLIAPLPLAWSPRYTQTQHTSYPRSRSNHPNIAVVVALTLALIVDPVEIIYTLTTRILLTRARAARPLPPPPLAH